MVLEKTKICNFVLYLTAHFNCVENQKYAFYTLFSKNKPASTYKRLNLKPKNSPVLALIKLGKTPKNLILQYL